MVHTIFLPFIDSPYQLCKPFYEKYPFLFNTSLYTPDIILITEHFIDLITKNTETKEGLAVKLKILLKVVEKRKQEGESKPELIAQVKEELEEITIKFVSVLDPKMSGEMYVNLAVTLWAVAGEEMPWGTVLGADVLANIDIIRYLKRKTVLEDQKK